MVVDDDQNAIEWKNLCKTCSTHLAMEKNSKLAVLDGVVMILQVLIDGLILIIMWTKISSGQFSRITGALEMRLVVKVQVRL